MVINRRHFLFLLAGTGTVAAMASLSNYAFAEASNEPFQAIPLPYAYDALQPYIDAETMHFHHDKHYVAYTKNLNAAVSKYPQLLSKTAEDLLKDINSLPEDIRLTVRNNGGGYVNHSMFWEIMSPDGGGEATGEIGKVITASFGSFKAFQEKFNQAGSGRFGSGWAWLVLDSDRQLQVISTPNQDSPLMSGMYPIMGNDVWEHAYYLKYKNNRGEYLNQWWNVLNWDEIDKRFQKAMKAYG